MSARLLGEESLGGRVDLVERLAPTRRHHCAGHEAGHSEQHAEDGQTVDAAGRRARHERDRRRDEKKNSRGREAAGASALRHASIVGAHPHETTANRTHFLAILFAVVRIVAALELVIALVVFVVQSVALRYPWPANAAAAFWALVGVLVLAFLAPEGES